MSLSRYCPPNRNNYSWCHELTPVSPSNSLLFPGNPTHTKPPNSHKSHEFALWALWGTSLCD